MLQTRELDETGLSHGVMPAEPCDCAERGAATDAHLRHRVDLLLNGVVHPLAEFHVR